MKKNRVLLTGGHAATTAIAVVQEIRARNLDWEIFFAGVKTAFEGKKAKTLESEALPKYGAVFLPLTAGRLQRKFTFWTVPSLLKIPVGFFQSVYYLLKFRPKVTLSFGGFASVPVVVASKVLGIPVVIHEQTASAGRANLFAARFADVIALAREESLSLFPVKRTIITGNPIMREISSFVSEKTKETRTIFVTGGSRGSQNINNAVGAILPTLLKKYNVVHQTGEVDYAKFLALKESLPGRTADKYTLFSQIDPVGIAKVYANSNLVIARSGANTVSDILALGTHAVFIPLPISYLDEQTKNAEYAVKFGNSEILKQKDLTPSVLLAKIDEYFSKSTKSSPGNTSKKRLDNPDVSAAAKIVDLLSHYLE